MHAAMIGPYFSLYVFATLQLLLSTFYFGLWNLYKNNFHFIGK